MRALDDAQGAITDVHFAGLAVQLKKERACPVGMRLADGKKFDNEGFSGFDFDGDFFAGLQAIEKRGRGQNADVRIGLAKLVVFGENVGIEQIAEQVVAAEGMTEFFLEEVLFFFKLHWFHVCSWQATKMSMAAYVTF